MRLQVNDLAALLQELAYEVRANRRDEAHEREKLTLRLEVALLRAGRELPPGDE